MSKIIGRVCAAVLLNAVAGLGVAHAGTPLTAEQTQRLNGYVNQVILTTPRDAAPSSAAAAAPVTVVGSAEATVVGQDIPQNRAKLLNAFIALRTPSATPAGVTLGIATGLGVQPALPDMEIWDKQASRAIVAAMKAPDANTPADQVATFAAATAVPVDPVFEERVSLVRTLFHVDGTEDLIRHFVATEHMKLIIEEVARHIDFSKLKETDKYRLSAIAAVAQTELEDKIVDLNARLQAANLSKPEIMQLIVAYDIDPQRKLTQMRLNDDGKIDRSAELDLRLAQYQIVKQYEAGQ